MFDIKHKMLRFVFGRGKGFSLCVSCFGGSNAKRTSKADSSQFFALDRPAITSVGPNFVKNMKFGVKFLDVYIHDSSILERYFWRSAVFFPFPISIVPLRWQHTVCSVWLLPLFHQSPAATSQWQLLNFSYHINMLAQTLLL